MWRESRVGKAEKKAYYTTFVLSSMITALSATYLHGWRYYVSAQLLSLAVSGFSSSLIFSLSHTTVDAEFDATTKWAENQVRSSYNWSVGSTDVSMTPHVVNFLVGGLNYQIEHHLFPTIHPIYYPSLAPIVKRYCGKYNIVRIPLPRPCTRAGNTWGKWENRVRKIKSYETFGHSYEQTYEVYEPTYVPYEQTYELGELTFSPTYEVYELTYELTCELTYELTYELGE